MSVLVDVWQRGHVVWNKSNFVPISFSIVSYRLQCAFFPLKMSHSVKLARPPRKDFESCRIKQSRSACKKKKPVYRKRSIVPPVFVLAIVVTLVLRDLFSFKMTDRSNPCQGCWNTPHVEMAFSEVVSSAWRSCLFSATWNSCSNETKTFHCVYVKKV